MTELLTTREIAQYLKLRPETVLRKVKEGEIPAIKIGGRFRFDKQLYSALASGRNNNPRGLEKEPTSTLWIARL